MSLVINTNIYSLQAQMALDKSQGPLQQAMQRLSSGLRINSAKDDAAGYAISTRQTTQINGLGVAIQNANDGLSFAQTAGGAMDAMTTSLQRINELAIQSASNNTSTDRTSLNQEVQQLISELNRVVSQTTYNGDTFLNQAKSINIQVGTNVNNTINVSTSNVSPTTMGVSTTYANSLTAADIAGAASLSYSAGGLGVGATLNGQDIGDALAASSVQNNSLNVINQINQYTSNTNVTAFSYGNALVGNNTPMVASMPGATTGATAYVDSGYLTINGTQVGSFQMTTAASAAISNLVSAINNQSTTTGVNAYMIDSSGASVTDAAATSQIVLANTSGAGISVSMDSGVANGSKIATNNFAAGTTSVDAGQNGKIIFNSDLTTTSLALDGSATGAAFGVGAAATSISLAATSVNSLTVDNVANANIAILATQKALDVITSEQAKLGAVQNRLDTTISNLSNVKENATQARSRITDANFAAESANLTKNLILQQAGISVLQRANNLNQNVLALLQ